jgi:hypothetical protein
VSQITCPTCGVARLLPRAPRIDEVPWADCACSDAVTCLAHRLDCTDAPSRPTDAKLAEKGQRMYVRRLEEFAQMTAKFEQAKRFL